VVITSVRYILPDFIFYRCRTFAQFATQPQCVTLIRMLDYTSVNIL